MSETETSGSALRGQSIVEGSSTNTGGIIFYGYNPADGTRLEPAFSSATTVDLEVAAGAAVSAAPVFAAASGAQRGQLLRAIADRIDAARNALVERAHLETALPHPRLTGEVARTSGQMRLFASLVEEGSWVDARIDSADPARTPPKPDLRSMLRPLGPVAVFGASNFPLAFSVAGGDTASALAAGNPVIVKAHSAHPGTGELVGRIIAEAVKSVGLPAGVFSLLFDAGFGLGAALVQHPAIRAVGFTGSFRGGKALLDLAAKRPDPIPVYAEMGSSNPVFLLPGALAERGTQIAAGLHASFTLGGGQFCTKPGIVFVPSFAEKSALTAFSSSLRAHTAEGPAYPLLTAGSASAYSSVVAERTEIRTATGTYPGSGFAAQTSLLETTAPAFFADPALAEEVFGPSTLLVHCATADQLLQAADSFHGHLTATVHGTEEDLHNYAALLKLLETKVGRIVINSFPTGVEVAHAMVHGGPWPATSDGRSTSVGAQAIYRFARPVSYQAMPQWALPAELQDPNPLQILRIVNGTYKREAL
jgi:NADP-dependent aldehyde dehydrogenase